MAPGDKGTVSVLREAPRSPTAQCDVELYLYAGLADFVTCPAVWLRATIRDGAATAAKAYFNTGVRGSGKGAELPLKNPQLTFRDGTLRGRLEAVVPGREAEPFALELDGRAIGRQLVGTVTFVQGDLRVTTSWIGLQLDSGAWRFPADFPRGEWTWEHDLPADAGLTARALEESQRAVMPGEPGKAGFWTWRRLARDVWGPVSVIHPPCFDLEETPGAATYRYAIQGRDRFQAEFTADKPWRPLAPAWKDLPPGPYRLVVTALDAEGRDLPETMRMGIRDKETSRRVVQEVPLIPFVKRPSFGGPYAGRRQDWAEMALATSRWHRWTPGYTEARGLSPMEGFHVVGKSAFGENVGAHLWANLANRALTRDPAEREFSEFMLAFVAEELEIHQRLSTPPGFFYAYIGHAPESRWAAEAVLDAYLQTGDDRWKRIALDYGRALVRLQKETGVFRAAGESADAAGPGSDVPPAGIEFGASELLYVLGRIRRDLKTGEFIEAERKALGWMKDVAVRERYWPCHVHHYQPLQWPVKLHAMSALYFVRYLLECAPPEWRDVALAEEAARWAEDVGVDWTRRPAGAQTGQITPFIPFGGRFNCDPVAVNLLAAIAFRQVARATGDALWAAKGEALAVAVTQAVDSATGYLQVGMQSKISDPFDAQFTGTYSVQVMSRAWAIQLLREYAAFE
jgi:hypothetical protein